MKVSMSKDLSYAITPFKIISWPVGTWPLENKNVFSVIRTIVAVLFLLLMVMVMQTEIYLDSSNAEKNLDALVLTTCGILAILKVMRFRIWSAGLTLNFVSAIKDYKELSDEGKREIVRRHAYMGRLAFTGLIFFSYLGSTIFMTVPMFVGEEKEVVNATEEDTRGYPIPSKYTVAVINIPKNMYLAIFIMEYLMLLVTSTGNLGSDSLFFCITFHLCGQIELLKLEFSKLAVKNERTAERFKLLTKRHIYLLNLAVMLDDTINFILFVQLFSSCILISTCGFQLILGLSVGNVVVVIKTFSEITVILVQLFVYSYVSDYLNRQMEGICNSAYFSSWYELPRDLAKAIVYTIMRAQDPIHLTAGKFFIVNMETYTSIIKTSMSYLSVLRVMVNA